MGATRTVAFSGTEAVEGRDAEIEDVVVPTGRSGGLERGVAAVLGSSATFCLGCVGDKQVGQISASTSFLQLEQ